LLNVVVHLVEVVLVYLGKGVLNGDFISREYDFCELERALVDGLYHEIVIELDLKLRNEYSGHSEIFHLVLFGALLLRNIQLAISGFEI